MSFELGQEVRIIEINTTGKIIGIWHTLYGQTQYQVRYYDTVNCKADMLYTAKELEIITQNQGS